MKDRLNRRTLIKSGAAAIAMPALLGANSASAQAKVIKIGHVSPRTGPLAGFGEADPFILDQVKAILAKGLQSGGKTYKVEIVSKDSQSSGSRAAEVASELILSDKVDLLVTSGTPDTTNPVSDQAEVNETPCVATNCPWQPYFFGRKGDPAKGFNWTYLFFWGLEDVIAAFTALWDGAPTNKVDLLVTSGTPDTTNPVSDQAEVNEMPCLATNCPWQPYFFGRKGDPAKGFNWTYLFFWGLEDVIAAFTALWDGAPTNKVVGGLFPNDADGNAWGDKERGLPPALAAAGYKLIDPGRYQQMNNDFSSQIAAFKSAGCEIVTGVMIPPDFATFWSQAAQQGFKPKIATIGKALLFPSAINALGARGNGLTSEIWWSPNHPFKSGLTGQSCKQLADAYTAATKRPWSQPIGFQHALFEVAIDIVKRAKAIEPKAILDAMVATNYQSIVGPVQWTGKPVKNVTKTPLVSGQWQRKGDKFELVIIANKPAPNIPVGGKLALLS